MRNLLNRFYLLTALFVLFIGKASAINSAPYVAFYPGKGYFPLSVNGNAATIYSSPGDYAGVQIALKNLQTDIASVTNIKPGLVSGNVLPGNQVVLVGTIGKSELIDGLIKNKKLDVNGISGKWETFIIQTVQNPMPGVSQALVIAGSDKRGTIFGIYDLSGQIGVSPWYYWADVPVKQHNALYIIPGRYSMGTPAVKYRGIFINDEAPAFSGWTKDKFGGMNHLAYQKVFELILRLKGNYLWPAMWGNAFNDDDKMNPVMADEYGVVMGTSHHEPMDRAQQEWKRYGKGDWNYDNNADVLKDFWRKGIQNMGDKETIVTIGMRGDGDMAMTEGSNVALLEKIVKDQRQILSEETKKDASQTPQLWALYKEVQDYYDKGMRVPNDVTLLLCDDNWGNIRKLPKLTDPAHAGGYGIYYHFDYVGGPRNYKWLNTNPISKIWEQMHMANQYGANTIWIVNVGDIKPMEFPISFFLDYAWAPSNYPASSLQNYTVAWAAAQFEPAYATDIADMISTYTKYNGRRKPELLDQYTYSLTNYREFETVVNDYNALEKKAEDLFKKLPAGYEDAYFELVLHPIKACANLNQLYLTVAKNKWYSQQGRAATNDMATQAAELFKKDAEISRYYNKVIANGKWNHMMDQTHIGYTYWQQPPVDKMPEVKQIELPELADMGVAIEGSPSWWPMDKTDAVLPAFNSLQNNNSYVEVFNRGKAPFTFKTQAPAYIKIFPESGTVNQQQRLNITINWQMVPAGVKQAQIMITADNGTTVNVQAILNKTELAPASQKTFYQEGGYIAIEAPHYSKAVATPTIKWETLPDNGRTLSAVTAFPVTAQIQKLNAQSPHLEYDINVTNSGEFKLATYVSPSLDFNNTGGLKFAVSVDDETPQIMNLQGQNQQSNWNKTVADNINILTSKHTLLKPGKHTLKYWMVSPGVVLQKLVLDCGGLKPSYLGPPESFYSGK
ncbi:glycosyl hydrolase family 115 (putative glucuronidase) [Mucilaginibacter gracilis]|uniref:Glycosyl hydrolase family 115 (Putative glucuronidase) n=1 Tax=Mucilaginibacter gracilis TaxID=423350 RepID=A0A495IXN1_9SPHI|nr:glycosyl hydrolase 115 family protein [Mucilaginibacter gracilis]RKR81456.1 glycosyl hydrolase family 115 (putative glucuronidase) [Mucilaginibacter gracilis]